MQEVHVGAEDDVGVGEYDHPLHELAAFLGHSDSRGDMEQEEALLSPRHNAMAYMAFGTVLDLPAAKRLGEAEVKSGREEAIYSDSVKQTVEPHRVLELSDVRWLLDAW